MSPTRVNRRVKSHRAMVYHALLDPRSVAKWAVRTGITSHVHGFDAR
jgi:uncharacterized protein YndB with AHSA1/START domain